jgi:hypothetical protein
MEYQQSSFGADKTLGFVAHGLAAIGSGTELSETASATRQVDGAEP